MPQAHILVVDDEQGLCNMMSAILVDDGYRVTAETDPVAAMKRFVVEPFSLVITDVKMPGMDGLEVLEQVKERNKATPVIMITAYATVEMSIQALRNGAFDILTKPFEPEELLHRVRKALRHNQLLEENSLLRRELAAEQGQFGQLVGKSQGLMRVVHTARKIAKRDIPVTILGESGTGKELVAKAIHQHSERSAKQFVAINCGAIPETLLESELFGHSKGAFTGADKEKTGLLEAADKGTLFMDEVGNLPINVQKALLRFLQEKEFYRLGDSQPTKVDVRIVSATNADLLSEMETGAFREDLFYRLAVVKLKLPPLRDRKTDIPLLAQHFVAEMNQTFNTDVKGFTPQAMQALIGYSWPGNVRELKNVVEASLAIESDELVGVDGLSKLMDLGVAEEGGQGGDQPESYADSLARFERHYFKELLEKAGGNVEEAANVARVNVATLYRKIKKYDLREG